VTFFRDRAHGQAIAARDKLKRDIFALSEVILIPSRFIRVGLIRFIFTDGCERGWNGQDE
jgi:glycogen synthase